MAKAMKLKVGLVGATQNNFAGGAGWGKTQLYANSVAGMQKLADKLDFELYVYPELLVTGADALKAKQVLEQEKIDFLMLQTTTFGAGDVVQILAKMDARLGIWALPEPSADGNIYFEASNSFCGLNMYGAVVYNYLKAYGIKYKWFYGFADNETFQRRLAITVRALTAIKKMAASRVALVGGIAPGFDDLYFDERIAQKLLGVDIQRGHEFSEIKQRAMAYSDSEIAARMEETISGYTCTCGASAKAREVHARFYQAHLDFCKEYGYDALAISCWPKMQEECDSYSCSIIGKLNQNGIPAACEGDLPGAVSMLLQKYITERPTTLMDLSNLDEDDQSILLWHCGPSPETMADSRGSTLRNVCQPAGKDCSVDRGLIVHMTMKPEHYTVMRLSGEWDRMFLVDGDMIPEKDGPIGSGGWMTNLRLNRQKISVQDLVNTILVQGMQHHYPMIAGDSTEELMEVAAWLGLAPMEAVPYENFLQVR